MELQYAPPRKSEGRRAATVIAAGLTSLLAAAAIAWALHHRGSTDAMRWYVGDVLPAGAALVGLAGSCGYCIALAKTGLKPKAPVLAAIMGIHALGFVGIYYADFRTAGPLVNAATGAPLSFPEYFGQIVTEARWEARRGSTGTREPAGEAGYAWIGLEFAAFVLAGAAVPFAMRWLPYCELCQGYMESTTICLVPASVWAKSIDRRNAARVESYLAESEAALEVGAATLDRLESLATAGDVEAFRAEVKSLHGRSVRTGELPNRISITLVRCRRCHSGHLNASMLIGDPPTIKPLGDTPLSVDFVKAYCVEKPKKVSAS